MEETVHSSIQRAAPDERDLLGLNCTLRAYQMIKTDPFDDGIFWTQIEPSSTPSAPVL